MLETHTLALAQARALERPHPTRHALPRVPRPPTLRARLRAAVRAFLRPAAAAAPKEGCC